MSGHGASPLPEVTHNWSSLSEPGILNFGGDVLVTSLALSQFLIIIVLE